MFCLVRGEVNGANPMSEYSLDMRDELAPPKSSTHFLLPVILCPPRARTERARRWGSGGAGPREELAPGGAQPPPELGPGGARPPAELGQSAAVGRARSPTPMVRLAGGDEPKLQLPHAALAKAASGGGSSNTASI